MNCPKCKSVSVYCIDSRQRDDAIRRRRECSECGYRFSTVEIELNRYKNLENNNIRIPERMRELVRKERLLTEIMECVNGVSKMLQKKEGAY